MTNFDDLDRKRLMALALKRQRAQELRECFDPTDPDSRPTPKQDEILRAAAEYLVRYVQGGNQSGKSATGAREVAWVFNREHPHVDIDELWPDEPVVILVVGRLNNQVEELWERKIKPFLHPGTFRENRQGGTLQYVVGTDGPCRGSKFIFATHNNPMEAREKLQSYTAHWIWLDELTDHLGIIEELQRRIQAKRGRMIVTYTPKIRAESVKKFIETPTPYSKVYRISMLDNPVYDDRRDEIMAQIGALPLAQQQTILEGEWYIGELSVFSFDPQKHLENPLGYSIHWPHVVSVDPAASGLMGYTLWAAGSPGAHRWYCIASEYLKGAAPSDLVDLVESKVAGLQVLYKIADTHEAWFFKQAAKMKTPYRGVPKKRDRKLELIANLNQALANGRVRITTTAPDLANELSTAQWSEVVENKIVNASHYHLADAAQYFVDQMPHFKEAAPEHLSFEHQLHLANQRRKENEQRDRQRQGLVTKPRPIRIVARRGSLLWSR